MKGKLEKYDFVRKYLNEADLVQISGQLQREGMGEEKWPLVVVEEAMRKMEWRGQ